MLHRQEGRLQRAIDRKTALLIKLQLERAEREKENKETYENELSDEQLPSNEVLTCNETLEASMPKPRDNIGGWPAELPVTEECSCQRHTGSLTDHPSQPHT